MLYVQSDFTNELEPCTIMQGVVGVDGVRRGAMADIDMFAAFVPKYDWDGNELPDVLDVYLKNKRTRKTIKKVLPPPTEDDLFDMEEQAERGEHVGRWSLVDDE